MLLFYVSRSVIRGLIYFVHSQPCLEGTNNIEIQGAVLEVCKGLNNSSTYGKSYIDYSNVYEHIIV